MMKYDYDLFVIGGGSGGVRASRMAALTGARVALAEESRMGGTCVIRGCIPKKLLVYASQFAENIQDAAGYGWNFGECRFDWPTLIANKDREIARLVERYTPRTGELAAASGRRRDARGEVAEDDAAVAVVGNREVSRTIKR